MQKHNLDDAKTLAEALYCVAGGNDETHAPGAELRERVAELLFSICVEDIQSWHGIDFAVEIQAKPYNELREGFRLEYLDYADRVLAVIAGEGQGDE